MRSEDLFKKHEDRIEIAFRAPPVNPARIEKGNDVVICAAGMNCEIEADRDGWQIYVDGRAKFLTNEDYANQVAKIETCPEKSIPAGADIKIVSKGETISIQQWSDTNLGQIKSAETDGIVMTIDQKRKFFSWAKFVAEFKTEDHPVAQMVPEKFKNPTEYRFIKDKTPIRYLILPEDTVIDFKDGPYEATAGQILFENPEDIDGYTLMPRDEFEKNHGFAQRSLPPSQKKRLSAPTADIH